MVIKKYGTDFTSQGGALTLPSNTVSDKGYTSYGVLQKKEHTSGWTIQGEVHKDYFEWVNFFDARHPVYGHVYGNFEKEVRADSEEAFQHFYKNHPPEAWNYGDI